MKKRSSVEKAERKQPREAVRQRIDEILGQFDLETRVHVLRAVETRERAIFPFLGEASEEFARRTAAADDISNLMETLGAPGREGLIAQLTMALQDAAFEAIPVLEFPERSDGLVVTLFIIPVFTKDVFDRVLRRASALGGKYIEGRPGGPPVKTFGFDSNAHAREFVTQMRAEISTASGIFKVTLS